MKKIYLIFILVITGGAVFAQTGHLMQGIGAFNMSMGGAATGQALDINGALQWNSAAISKFDSTIATVDIGLMFSSPTLYSTVPTQNGPVSGSTDSELGASPLPSLAVVFGKKDSKHTFGISMFGVSGFGVDFPESTTNPINFPQSMGGFGHIKSSYMLMQIGITYSYSITDKLSVGVEPVFNYESLKVEPNPLTSPSMTYGYPNSDNASAVGFGAQIGVYYGGEEGFKAGVSYKTEQFFGDFTFNNTYLDGSEAPDNTFQMNFPAIFSAGVGFSKEMFDFALDYRHVFYSGTEGFEAKGWAIGDNGYPTGAVAGFGWQDMDVISVGLQIKAIDNFPVRLGYTYNSNPIDPELAMYSVSATAVIKNAVQFGFGFKLSDLVSINAAYHHGMSGEKTSGQMLNPMMITSDNPYGAVPGSEVAYDMTTDLIVLGATFTF
ncbi:MAG: hydrocarbon degradation protein [Chlorobi bacterium]|nr:hydrocarbon degradation protein [Chlorobiota bacterium]